MLVERGFWFSKDLHKLTWKGHLGVKYYLLVCEIEFFKLNYENQAFGQTVCHLAYTQLNKVQIGWFPHIMSTYEPKWVTAVFLYF